MELFNLKREAGEFPQQDSHLHVTQDESKPSTSFFPADFIKEKMGYIHPQEQAVSVTTIKQVASGSYRILEVSNPLKHEQDTSSHAVCTEDKEGPQGNTHLVESSSENNCADLPDSKYQPDENCLKKAIKIEADIGYNENSSGYHTETVVWSVACNNLKHETDIKQENSHFEIMQTSENQQAVELTNENLISGPTKRIRPDDNCLKKAIKVEGDLGNNAGSQTDLQRSGTQNLQQIEDVCLESDDSETMSLPDPSSYVTEQDFQQKECSIVLERCVSFSVTQDSIPGATLPRIEAYSDELFYVCSDCGVGFSVILQLQSHLWTHIAHLSGHQKEPWKTMYSYNCEECNYIFTSVGLEDHLLHGPHKRHKTQSFKKTPSFKGSLIDQKTVHKMDNPCLKGNKFHAFKEGDSSKEALMDIEGLPKLDTPKVEGNRVCVGLLSGCFSNQNHELIFKCTECNLGFAQQYIQAHLRTHVGKSQTVGDTEHYRCGQCDNYFSLERLKIHLSSPTLCSKTRLSRIKPHHAGRKRKVPPKGPRHKKRRTSIPKKPQEPNPDIPFLNGQPLFVRLSKNPAYMCRVCHLRLPKHELPAHVATHMKGSQDVAVVNRYCCGYCGKYFTQRKLEEHFSSSSATQSATAMKSNQQKSIGHSFIIDRMKGETIMIDERCSGGERSTLTFLCGSCNEAFPEKYKLDCHICEVEKVVEAVGRPGEIFQCEFCFECFETKESLDIHRSNHTGGQAGQKFTCEVCKKQFTHEFVYWVHKTIHTSDNSTPEEEPTSSSRDTENEQTCDVKVGEHCIVNSEVTECSDAKPSAKDNQLVCHVCGKDFMTILALEFHMTLHIDVKITKIEVCDRCKLGFIDKKLHVKHICFNREDEMYICGHCQRRFKQRDLLRHHLYTHSVIREDPMNVPKSSQPPSQTRAKEESSAGHGPSRSTGLYSTKKKKTQCGTCFYFFKTTSDLKRHELTHT